MQVGDILVERISGPVSMYYMKPPAPRVNGMDCPLVLLFGDYHYSEENMCEKCDRENGCYPIYDKEFLKNIDKLAEEYPIDFYTESNKGRKKVSEKGGVLFYRLMNATYPCHDVMSRLDQRYEDECPTRNVRWHYADSRFYRDALEYRLLGPLFRTDPLTPFEKQIIDIFYRALDQKLLYEDIMDELGELIVNELMAEGGMAYKQRYENFKDFVSLWKTTYHRKVMNTHLRAVRKEEFKKLYTDSTMKTYYKYLFVSLEAPVLDMYYISRMLKKPKGNINSYLALGFFGHAHTTGICEFLHSVLGYEYVYKVDYREDVRRCIPIEIPIHLADDLKAYKRDGIELYHRQLDVERRHRAFMLSGKMEQYDPRSFGEIVNNYLVDVTGDKSMRECVLTLLEEVIVKWNTNRYAPQYTHEIVLACILSLLDVDILQKYKYLNKGVIERMINYIKKRPMRFKKYGKNRCILRFDEDEKELLSPIEELLLRADKKFIKVFHLDDLDHLYEIDNVHIANNVRLKVRTILRLFGAKEIDLYNWAMEVVKIVSGFCNGLYNARYKNALIMSIAIILVKIRSSWSEVYIIDHLTGREKVDPKVVIPMIQLIESKLENFIGNKFL